MGQKIFRISVKIHKIYGLSLCPRQSWKLGSSLISLILIPDFALGYNPDFFFGIFRIFFLGKSECYVKKLLKNPNHAKKYIGQNFLEDRSDGD